MNSLEEKYNVLMQFNTQTYTSEAYLKEVLSTINLIITCDSSFIKDLLKREVKEKFSDSFPVWLELLLFKIYVLQNPNDKEMYELGLSEIYRQSAEDINVIEKALTPNS